MDANTILRLKCSAMEPYQLESLKNLTNYTYQKMITEAETPDETKGFEAELNNFNEIIDNVIAEKVIAFISQ